MIAGASDFQSLALCFNAVTFVDVIYTIGKPYAAVTIVSFNGVNGLTGAGGLYALSSDLPSGLIDDRLTSLEGQAAIIGELTDTSNIYHGRYSPFLFFFSRYGDFSGPSAARPWALPSGFKPWRSPSPHSAMDFVSVVKI